MSEIYKRERSVTKAFAHYGIGDYTRKETRITARLPNTNEARLLELPRSQPLLVTESVNIDAERRASQYDLGRMAAERAQFTVPPTATRPSPPSAYPNQPTRIPVAMTTPVEPTQCGETLYHAPPYRTS